MLGENIKGLRNAYNLNKVGLAAKLGVSKQTISNWENNNVQPSIDTLIKIARVFDVTTDYLLDMNISDRAVDVRDLTPQEIANIQAIVDDIRKNRKTDN